MSIYELSYASAVMCYRNIDILEERHSVCDKADEKLFDIIHKEFCRRFDMLVKVLTYGVTNEEEYAFMYYLAICSRGYEQWDKPRIIHEAISESLAEFVLKDVKKAFYAHERLNEIVMKKLNKSVHDRLFTWFVYNSLC